MLSERRDAKLMRDALSVYAEPTASLAIGPEGGWTDEELAAARAAGFAEVSLGTEYFAHGDGGVGGAGDFGIYALGD